MILDQHLTWRKLIEYVENRCQKDLNLLRAISGTSWGTSSDTQLDLYKSLIRSKIDYGCEAFHSASNTAFRHLDRIQYKALMLATGHSLEALQVEKGELPLKLRREQQYYRSGDEHQTLWLKRYGKTKTLEMKP